MHQVVVIGAGLAGIGMAIALKHAGRHDFVVLEGSDDLAAPADDAFAPYSFESPPGPSRSVATRHDAAEYLRHCADKYEVKPHIRFGAEVASAVHDGVSATWSVETADGTSYRAQVLVETSPAPSTVGGEGPNLFRLAGPVSTMERRIADVARALDILDGGSASKARRPFLGNVPARLRRIVWRIGGCVSWYTDRPGE